MKIFKSIAEKDKDWAQCQPTHELQKLADALKVRQYVEFKSIGGDYVPESSRESLFQVIDDELQRRASDPSIGCCGFPKGDMPW